MAKIKRCVICDEKLEQGRCRLCGLDHTRMMKAEYRLNTTRPHSSYQNSTQQRSTSKRIKAQDAVSQRNTAQRNTAQRNTAQRDTAQKHTTQRNTAQSNTRQRSTSQGKYNRKATAEKKKSSLIKVLPTILAVVFALIGFAGEIIDDYSFGTYETGLTEVEYDPFEDAQYVLSDVGNFFETQLTAGEYIVGVHLPEGYYDIEILEGEGYLDINDSANGVYDWNFFDYEGSEDSVLGLGEYPLYQGALVTIENSAVLQFQTDSGQTDIMNYIENPVSEDAVIQLESGQQYVVGEDLPAGVYDAWLSEAWGNLNCGVPTDSEEYDMDVYRSIWMDAESDSGNYKNIVLNDGILINTDVYEGGYVTLIPSETVDPNGYDAYYDLYW